MSSPRIALSLAAVAALLGAGNAAAGAAKPTQSCFFINQWEGWKSPSPNVIYLGVNMHDVYRVDLSAGSWQLQAPNMHLVSINRGSSSICTALDLDLKIADSMGFAEPLIAKSLVKLTPEEVAAIPKKDRPN